MSIKPYFWPKYIYNIKLKKLKALVKLDKLKAFIKLNKLEALLLTLKVPYKPTKPTKTIIKCS